MQKSALVVFGKTLPANTAEYEVVFASKELERTVPRGVRFEPLEILLSPGSVQEASEVARKASLITTRDGARVAKSVLFKGYELWWTHYDEMYYKFCLPYTEYRPLLERLAQYRAVHLYAPRAATLMRYYLEAHGCRCSVEAEQPRRLLSASMWLQVALNVPFVLWLKLRAPMLMLTTSDLFDPPRDHDFRLRYIYEELYKRQLPFMECVRSVERWSTMLAHAWRRRRPVLYTRALVEFAYLITRRGGRAAVVRTRAVGPAHNDPESMFLFLLATHYLQYAQGDIWAIRLFQRLFRFIGLRVGIVNGANSRNFPELLAAKLAEMPVVGVLHGAPAQSYVVFEFMPQYDGKKSLAADRYGLWSTWWREYFIAHSKVYKPGQLFVSGPMRPIVGEDAPHVRGKKYKVLFASEQLAAMQEVMPYLDTLLVRDDIIVYFKFRSYRDGFKEWLLANRPDVLTKIPPEQILTGTMGEAISATDVVVGSHSTGVLEALLYLRPFIFYKTKKWGDYFDLKMRIPQHDLYAESPEELTNYITKSRDVPEAFLLRLREQFFGDPRQNGSAWVVDQAQDLLAR